jgi:hypothetical protein
MEALQCPISTEVTTAMTPGVARALVRIHRAGMKVMMAADLRSEQELAEATGVLVIAFTSYEAKLDIGGERSVTLALSAEQHGALGEVKRCGAQLAEVLTSKYSPRALSIAHFELVRALDAWRGAVRFPPPVFRGAPSLQFE